MGGKTLAVMLALVSLAAGCEQPAGGNLSLNRPVEWSSEQRASLSEVPFVELCRMYREGRARSGVYTADDLRLLEGELRLRGLSLRDIDLIRNRSGTIGTGQSWQGLSCSQPGTMGRSADVRIINRSFYPGVGHTWQVRAYRTYVYLRGDGTEKNMRVHSWN
jgi:hypothetical protein